MGELEEAISHHVETHHLGLEKEDIEQAFREHYSLIENGRKLDMLVDDWFGPPVVDIDGETSRDGGYRKQSNERWKVTTSQFELTNKRLGVVEHAMKNGGIPAHVKLSKNQKRLTVAVGVPLFVASLGVVGQIIVALIS